MRKALLLTPLLLGGCTMFTPPYAPAFEGMCDAAAAQRFVGQPVSQEAGTAIRVASRAALFRWIGPNMMITMEHHPSRVNVHYGTDYRIGSINCG